MTCFSINRLAGSGFKQFGVWRFENARAGSLIMLSGLNTSQLCTNCKDFCMNFCEGHIVDRKHTRSSLCHRGSRMIVAASLSSTDDVGSLA